MKLRNIIKLEDKDLVESINIQREYDSISIPLNSEVSINYNKKYLLSNEDKMILESILDLFNLLIFNYNFQYFRIFDVVRSKNEIILTIYYNVKNNENISSSMEFILPKIYFKKLEKTKCYDLEDVGYYD